MNDNKEKIIKERVKEIVTNLEGSLITPTPSAKEIEKIVRNQYMRLNNDK